MVIRRRQPAGRTSHNRLAINVPRALASTVAAGLLLAIMGVAATPALADKDCSGTSTGLTPLTDLGTGTYLGYEGGLYPGGGNEMPAEHLQVGMALATQVVPRNGNGEPAADGRIGLLAIGVSNTHIEFSAFQGLIASDGSVSSALVLVNGAQGSRALEDWVGGTDTPVWRTVDDELGHAGITADQVQVAWVKLPNAERGTVDLAAAGLEIEELIIVMQELSAKFPNLRLAYFSSRIYGGYALGSEGRTRGGAPEPKAYQHGFTVKWLIEQQLNGDPRLNPDPAAGAVEIPWASWGPYLWADGLTPRQDGLIWECEDIDNDGVHPSASGADKVAKLLFDHFSTDPTSSGWFLEGAPPPTTTAAVTSTTGAIASTTAAPQTTTTSPEVPAPDSSSSILWVLVAVTILVGAGVVVIVRLLSGREYEEEGEE